METIKIMLTLILLSLFWIVLAYRANATEISCEKHPIYCQIVENKPTINKSYAFELSNVVYKASKLYNIPKHIYTAILMQESGYKLDSKRCYKGIRNMTQEEYDYVAFLCKYKSNNEKKCLGETNKVKVDLVCEDIGISQINYKTIFAYKFSIKKLLTDLEYSIEAGAKVLQWFKKTYADKEKYWWVRYNCGTHPNIDRNTCQIYKKRVLRYLN